ncbi:hypothetical protein LZ30DRAFT_700515 [Colletotrichum cereale]|nr:hypothetical protein LZ30DRAFT_700515 [Colletotrichum cereale]
MGWVGLSASQSRARTGGGWVVWSGFKKNGRMGMETVRTWCFEPGFEGVSGGLVAGVGCCQRPVVEGKERKRERAALKNSGGGGARSSDGMFGVGGVLFHSVNVGKDFQPPASSPRCPSALRGSAGEGCIVAFPSSFYPRRCSSSLAPCQRAPGGGSILLWDWVESCCADYGVVEVVTRWLGTRQGLSPRGGGGVARVKCSWVRWKRAGMSRSRTWQAAGYMLEWRHVHVLAVLQSLVEEATRRCGW